MAVNYSTLNTQLNEAITDVQGTSPTTMNQFDFDSLVLKLETLRKRLLQVSRSTIVDDTLQRRWVE